MFMRLITFIPLLLLTSDAFAATQKSLVGSIIINIIPILLFVGVFWFLMKNVNSVNNRIAESNEAIRDQLKRIADNLDKSS